MFLTLSSSSRFFFSNRKTYWWIFNLPARYSRIVSKRGIQLNVCAYIRFSRIIWENLSLWPFFLIEFSPLNEFITHTNTAVARWNAKYVRKLSRWLVTFSAYAHIHACIHTGTWHSVARAHNGIFRASARMGNPIYFACLCHRGVTCLQKSWKCNDKVITRHGRTSNESREEPLALRRNCLPLNNSRPRDNKTAY